MTVSDMENYFGIKVKNKRKVEKRKTEHWRAMKRYKIVRHKYEWSSRAKIERKQGRRNFEKIKAKISPKTAKTYINPQSSENLKHDEYNTHTHT